MRYALNLADDGRILSVTYEQYAAPGQPIVDTLPEGNVNDYLYVNGEFVYDPLPVPDTALTAETNILKGKYFMVGEEMYFSTTNIPAGDIITPGTNCERMSMSEALNALNS